MLGQGVPGLGSHNRKRNDDEAERKSRAAWITATTLKAALAFLSFKSF